MDSPIVVTTVTVALIVLSAFFVAVEFALLAARRHRLEERAGASRSARAALRSYGELTVLLAGCQLGITACALGLGAITKPAVNYALTPLFEGWGAPSWLADTAGFALALVIVTFLHLVIGEMAPKSWAIAHPETSATMLALPMRGYMWLFRPVLSFLNEAANWCLRRVGVEPQANVASGQNPSDLRQLVEHSASVGALELAFSSHLTEALDLGDLTVGDLVDVGREITAVPADSDMPAVRAAARRTGHLRVLLTAGDGTAGAPGSFVGVVHVRDTMLVPDDHPATELVRAVKTLDGSTPVYAALRTMRETRTHLVLVATEEGVGVLTLTDVLARLFPQPTPA